MSDLTAKLRTLAEAPGVWGVDTASELWCVKMRNSVHRLCNEVDRLERLESMRFKAVHERNDRIKELEDTIIGLEATNEMRRTNYMALHARVQRALGACQFDELPYDMYELAQIVRQALTPETEASE
jgi:hypothetical protein